MELLDYLHHKCTSGIFLCGIYMLVLCGCTKGTYTSDLELYIAEVKQKASMEIFHAPENVAPSPVVSPPITGRNPFQANSTSALPTHLNNPLLSYALEDLKMIGILKIDQKIWAWVTTPNGLYFRISDGQELGKNHGIVKLITDTSITVEELKVNEGHSDQRTVIIKCI